MYSLELYEKPENYIGDTHYGDYVFLHQNRDSDLLTRCNFKLAYSRLLGLTVDSLDDNCNLPCDFEHTEYSNGISIVRERHWACGWLEYILISGNNLDALEKARSMVDELNDYPILCEEYYSECRYKECFDYWESLNPSDRLGYVRQLGHCCDSFIDLLAMVKRGESLPENFTELLM